MNENKNLQNHWNRNHWNDDALLDRLYGLDPAPDLELSHFDRCADCLNRWNALQLRHAALTAEQAALGEDRLRAQRTAIWNRIEQSRRPLYWRAVPALSTALLLVAAVALHIPRPGEPKPDRIEYTQLQPVKSDTEFFNEIASVVNADTPRAADPIRALFDVNAMEGQAQ
jgi:hypothetical protein